MKIPEHITNGWKLLIQHGDISKIMKEKELKRFQVTDAIRGWSHSEDIYKKVSDYFTDKARRIIEINNQNAIF